MCHICVSDFERQVVGNDNASAQSWLNGRVEGVLYCEAAKTHASIELYHVGYRPVIFDICVKFSGIDFTFADDGINVPLCVIAVEHVKTHDLRCENVFVTEAPKRIAWFGDGA